MRTDEPASLSARAAPPGGRPRGVGPPPQAAPEMVCHHLPLHPNGLDSPHPRCRHLPLHHKGLDPPPRDAGASLAPPLTGLLLTQAPCSRAGKIPLT